MTATQALLPSAVMGRVAGLFDRTSPTLTRRNAWRRLSKRRTYMKPKTFVLSACCALLLLSTARRRMHARSKPFTLGMARRARGLFLPGRATSLRERHSRRFRCWEYAKVTRLATSLAAERRVSAVSSSPLLPRANRLSIQTVAGRLRITKAPHSN